MIGVILPSDCACSCNYTTLTPDLNFSARNFQFSDVVINGSKFVGKNRSAGWDYGLKFIGKVFANIIFHLAGWWGRKIFVLQSDQNNILHPLRVVRGVNGKSKNIWEYRLKSFVFGLEKIRHWPLYGRYDINDYHAIV